MTQKSQRGMTVVEMTIAMLVVMVTLSAGLSFFWSQATQFRQSRDLESFTADVFDAMDLLYFEGVNVSRCMGDVPTTVSVSTLIDDGMLDSSYGEDQWYNPSLATLTYLTNSVSGFGYAMQIAIETSDLAYSYPYRNNRYFSAADSALDLTTVYFEKRLSYQVDESNWLYLGDDFCE
jgi:Tfp pilus assembly protein PilW